MKLSRRFTLTMAIVALVLFAAKSARSDEPQISAQQVPAEPSHEEWTMEIQPASQTVGRAIPAGGSAICCCGGKPGIRSGGVLADL